MILFPLAAALVSAAFSAILWRQFARRRRFSQLAWSIALAQFALASLAVAWGIGSGWGPFSYRVYWLFGALLNVPWLALGSVALLNRRVLTLLALLAVLVGSAWGFVKVFGANIDERILGETTIPRGRDAWTADPSVRTLASYYSIPAWLVVVGVAALSGRPRKGVRPPVERVRASWTIAAGVTIVAVGSTALARLGRGSAFSITLALGVAVMFVGFLGASRAPRGERDPEV